VHYGGDIHCCSHHIHCGCNVHCCSCHNHHCCQDHHVLRRLPLLFSFYPMASDHLLLKVITEMESASAFYIDLTGFGQNVP
ncbi:hypothetical protein Celaphus_00011390, partial [Cervus elaphus hippelaphus]